jgi:hypothetical protein
MPCFIACFEISEHGPFGQNDPEEENVLDMLSSYIDQSDGCSSNRPLQVEENIFEHVNCLRKEQDNDSNIVTNHVEDNDLNMMNVCNEQQNNDSNIINVHHEQQDNDSNNTHVAEEEQFNYLDNAFSSPAAWRTRSKSKAQNKMFQQKRLFIYLSYMSHIFVCIFLALSNTDDPTNTLTHSKRTAKNPKPLVKKFAVSKALPK